MDEKLQMINCIPPEKLPKCWNDENRLNVLYAPIRSRNANPHDWDSKFEFWREMIKLYCEHSKNYKFSIPDLQKSFNRSGRLPGCLEEVVNEMLRLRQIQPLNDYLSQVPTRTWTNWAVQVLIAKPAKWTFKKVVNTLLEKEKNPEYVHLDAIRNSSKELLQNIPESYLGKVMDMQELIKILNWPPEKVDGLKILLHYLYCEGNTDLKDAANVLKNTDNKLTTQLIKIDKKVVQPINNLDVNIHLLEENEQFLTEAVERQESEINKIREEAKSCLKKGHRQMAKSLLVKKGELQKKIDKKLNALHNVRILLTQIKDVENDAEVLSSYKLALSSLQSSTKSTGLSEDEVTETMLNLGDFMDAYDDIQASLAQPIKDEDTEELEKELADLMLTDVNKNDESESTKDEVPEKSDVKDYNFDEDEINLRKRLEALKSPIDSPSDLSERKNKLKI